MNRGSAAGQPQVKRGSTPGFVSPSVYIGFRLFVLLEIRSRDVSSMLWRVREQLVPKANSSVSTQSCPTPPRHPAGRHDRTRPWYVRVLDSKDKLCSGKTSPGNDRRKQTRIRLAF